MSIDRNKELSDKIWEEMDWDFCGAEAMNIIREVLENPKLDQYSNESFLQSVATLYVSKLQAHPSTFFEPLELVDIAAVYETIYTLPDDTLMHCTRQEKCYIGEIFDLLRQDEPNDPYWEEVDYRYQMHKDKEVG